MCMGSTSCKRGRSEEEPVAVAAGFEAPIFGVRAVGQVTTLVLEGEDGPLASRLRGIASDHAGGWYLATKDSLLHVSAAGRVRAMADKPERERAVCDRLRQPHDPAGGGGDGCCDDARG